MGNADSSDNSRFKPKTRILCVDDHPGNLLALETTLKDLGHELVLAGSGPEALERVTNEDFAVILLDVQMPGMDGFETARKIRQIPRARSTSIIFLTANNSSDSYALQGYEAGAVDYLFKPLNTELLRAKVNVFVELFRKTIEIKRQSELLLEMERRDQLREIAEFKRISERRYQRLIEGIRDGIVWSAQPDLRRFTFISPRAEPITGYPMELWLTRSGLWESCLHPEDRAKMHSALAELRKSGASIRLEHRLIRPGGETIWLHTEMHLDQDLDPAGHEIRGLSVDVTHLKETERALRAAIQIRDEFLTIASHELRTPITPLQLQMQGFIHLIESEKLDHVPTSRLKEMLEISDSQVARLSRLISQLLDVSRIVAGRLVLDIGPVELGGLVREVLRQLRHEIEASECRVTLDIPGETWGRWDGLRLEQVVVNLLTNAMKYGAGQPIEIAVGASPEFAWLSVRDHGMGIEPGDQERIFGKFERAVSSMHFSGLGLGLYITKQILDLHHGSIAVKSAPGEGACFTVLLPRESKEPCP